MGLVTDKTKAWFKRRILHAPNRITKLNARKMRRLNQLRTFAPIATKSISSAHAIHWSRACHVIFKRAHRVENSTKHRADDLGVNLVCEYFCWMLGDPHFFFGRSLPFLTLSIILKNKKNLCVGSFNYFSYTIKKRVELVHEYRCA